MIDLDSHQYKSSGFTLFEIMFVIIICGLIIVPLTFSYLQFGDHLKNTKTKSNISEINDALAWYSSQNFRIPCPADPFENDLFGSEIGSNKNSAGIGSCQNHGIKKTEGIVPFMTLGLDPKVIKDGWGNYFTYQVSSTFTQDMSDDKILVHAKCRTTKWMQGFAQVNGSFSGGRNISAKKARFCCMKPNEKSQTHVFYKNGARETSVILYKPDEDSWFNRADIIETSNLIEKVKPNKNKNSWAFKRMEYGGEDVMGYTDVVVYALISHGQNGAGAFFKKGKKKRMPSKGKYERINSNVKNNSVYILPYSNSNQNYYDDIVSWQTQNSLLLRLGKTTCATP